MLTIVINASNLCYISSRKVIKVSNMELVVENAEQLEGAEIWALRYASEETALEPTAFLLRELLPHRSIVFRPSNAGDGLRASSIAVLDSDTKQRLAYLVENN